MDQKIHQKFLCISRHLDKKKFFNLTHPPSPETHLDLFFYFVSLPNDGKYENFSKYNWCLLVVVGELCQYCVYQ